MKKSTLYILFIFSALWFLIGCDSGTVIEDAEESEEAGIHSVSEEKPEDSEESRLYSLTFKDNLVTLKAKNADLRAVLKELASKSEIDIDLGPGIRARLSISFEGLSLEEAFKRITPNYSAVFNKKEGKNEYRITKVVIAASSEMTGTEGPPVSAEETVKDSKGPVHQPDENKAGGGRGTEIEIKPQGEEKGYLETKEKTIPAAEYVPDELVVRFRQDLTPEEIGVLIKQWEVSIEKYIEDINYYVLKLPAGLSVDEARTLFQKQKAVEHAEPNYLITVESVPNDTHWGLQWALHNTGQSGGTPDADIDAVEAWDIQTGKVGDEAVVIAIVDTGIDYNHEDLEANIWINTGEIADDGIDNDGNGYVDDVRGWDFVDGVSGVTPALGEDIIGQDNDPMDFQGHGTRVAGIAGAVTNNNKGIAGVAWNCRLMPIRVGFKTSDGNGVLESVAATQGILYAARNGAQVINLSWGSYFESKQIKAALKEACDLGVIICAAAGNENISDPIYPAASGFGGIIAVGATDNNDEKADFSNYGNWVDVAAPGVSIISTYLGDLYATGSGTSLASPFVAGLAALLFSHFDGISAEEVKERIMSSVDVLPSLYGENITSGRINALQVLTIKAGVPGIISLDPSSAHQGDEITILGNNYKALQSGGYVTFSSNKQAQIISWSNHAIVCKVPTGAETGMTTVTTTEGRSNGLLFTLLPSYYKEQLLVQHSMSYGLPGGIKGDDKWGIINIHFDFPFFDREYRSFYVSTNGFIDFTKKESAYLNSVEGLINRVMIAPLWDDLTTGGSARSGEDIYIYTEPGLMKIGWRAERLDTGTPVNMEVVLYPDGRIQFNYGSGNGNGSNDLSPTIGISGGDGTNYHLSSHDMSTNLYLAQSVLFTPISETGSSGGGGGGGGCFISVAKE